MTSLRDMSDNAAAKPLKHPKYEIFARQRALNQSPLIAGQIAGLNYDRRNLFRIEKKPAVAARIAWLSRDEEENLRRKRRRLEEFLWDVLESDRADFYETVEIALTDRNGMPILDRNGRPRTRTINQLKPLERLSPTQRRLIESISYTESGKPNLKLVSKEYAHRELRRMIGGNAEQTIEKTNSFANYSDAELFAELGRLAEELGIKTTLTIESSDE
jgi:hypothetical protein